MTFRNSAQNTKSRRDFIKQSGLGLLALSLPFDPSLFLKHNDMEQHNNYDVLIIGGSYSGLAAAMALGRSLKKVLVIDGGKPCNRQTPHSHNFVTHDGKTPKEIAQLAKKQVEAYPTVEFFNGFAQKGSKTASGFSIETDQGNVFTASKLVFATGIKDIMPPIEGFAECWGISVLHCPYCHGYEVKHETTGILGNGDYAFEFGKLISNWTKELTIYTNGKSVLTTEQTLKLQQHNIAIVEKEIERLEHRNGQLQNIHFKDGTQTALKVIYTKTPFVQHSTIPERLGCELTEDGYLKVDGLQKTTVPGVYACGDNASRIRTVANAVAMGTTAGMMLNKELVFERF